MDEQYEWPKFTEEEKARLKKNFSDLGGHDEHECFGALGCWPRKPTEDVKEWRRNHAAYLKSLERDAR
jgi:hypothetical protein